MHARVHQLIPAGDSVLVICRVVRVYWDDDDGEQRHEPLLYHKGAYSAAVPLAE
jgi:flavin reductase (DIM6/NTAB) family NADH-FMN oxidoreductase RutF